MSVARQANRQALSAGSVIPKSREYWPALIVVVMVVGASGMLYFVVRSASKKRVTD